ncbi:AAA family ATPase [Micromonospora haikouensis]|uniref:P-loop NTPase n=1 Tax=Micromonospora haikouensis TaxID=686309 RepID=UPI003441EED3
MYRSVKLEKGRRNAVLLKGLSGSGKTALLMRLAYELETRGLIVAWIDRAASNRISEIVRQVEELAPDVILIDDLDIFGDSSASLVRRLNRNGQSAVVASVRTTRIWAIDTPSSMASVDGDSNLTDHDLKGLLSKLEEAGLLGELLRTSESERVDRLRDLSRRDLLAALIQVVTGQPFEQRVQSEYGQLQPAEQNAYSLVCFGASRVYEALYLPEQDLLQMLAPASLYGDSLAHISKLVESRLIVRDEMGLRVRHRAIADAVVRSLSNSRVAEMVGIMLFFYAGRAAHIRDASHPDRRQLIHLLSHSHMVDLKLEPKLVRPIYEKVQALLAKDFHFWLQRGAYEVERGDLDLADSYLESARACDGGDRDFKVITEWGFMRLSKARRNADDRSVQSKAIVAVGELERIVRREGARSPHTFTILVRHGTEWLRESRVLGDAERRKLALRIQDVLHLGMEVVRDNRDFRRAANEMKVKIEALASGGEEPHTFPLA